MNHNTTIVVHSLDNQEVGVAHEVKLPKNQILIFPDNNGTVLVRTSLQIDPKYSTFKQLSRNF